MDTIKCDHFHEVGQADFVFPINGQGYLKLYEPEVAHTYSVAEINTILNTEWWYYILTSWNDCIFFGTKESGQERNLAAEVYYNIGKVKSWDNGKLEFYGNVLAAYIKHVDFEQLLQCKLNLRWREHVLKRNHDVFYPVISNKKGRLLTPAKGKFYGLEELQKLVGGYIELVNVDEGHYIVCHEEELLKKHPRKDIIFNALASILAQKIIWGPALLIKKSRLEV